MTLPRITTHDILARIDLAVAADDSQKIGIHIEYSHERGLDGEVEIKPRAAILVETEGPEPDDRQVRELAARWLNGEGYLSACERAEERGA